MPAEANNISRREAFSWGAAGALAVVLGACGSGGDKASVSSSLENQPPNVDDVFKVNPINGFAAPYFGVSTGDRIQHLKGDKPAIDTYFKGLAGYGNMTRLDAVYGKDISVEMAAAKRYGIGVIILILGSDDVRPNDLASFTEDLVARHGSQNNGAGVAFEVGGNEPNGDFPDPALFAKRAVLQAQAVKTVGKGVVKVISGGLRPAVNAPDGNEIAPATFTRKWLTALNRSELGLFDMIGMHPYDFPSTTHEEAWSSWHQMSEGPGDGETETMRDIMSSFVLPPNIAITEVGATTTGDSALSETAQLDVIRHALLTPVPNVQTPYRIIFTLNDDPSQQNFEEIGFGISGKSAGDYMLAAVSKARG